MNELELKHLAGYLPYGLTGICKEEFTGIETVYGINYYKGSSDVYLITSFDDLDIEYFKPILRPLSDITKEIEVNGEKFVPIDNFIWKTSVEDFTEFPEQKHNLIHGLKYADVQLLLEWHFDIFGLIEKDLAIDINALNK